MKKRLGYEVESLFFYETSEVDEVHILFKVINTFLGVVLFRYKVASNLEIIAPISTMEEIKN